MNEVYNEIEVRNRYIWCHFRFLFTHIESICAKVIFFQGKISYQSDDSLVKPFLTEHLEKLRQSNPEVESRIKDGARQFIHNFAE